MNSFLKASKSYKCVYVSSPTVPGASLLITKTQSWDWKYGQTPEFTYSIPLAFTWGSAVSSSYSYSPNPSPADSRSTCLQELAIHSKHGRILEATLENVSSDDAGLSALHNISSALIGQPYGALGDLAEPHSSSSSRAQEIWDAIQEGM